MRPYRYEPLKDGEIRLVTLPSRASGTTAVKIWTAKQSEGQIPEYEALSYAWGSTANLEAIEVRPFGTAFHTTLHRRRGRSSVPLAVTRNLRSARHLQVTKNLVGALEALRLPDRPRILWIDAICINQQDLAEKGVQVARMASIYKSAARVVVWLGPSTDRLLNGLAALAQMASMVEVNINKQTMTPTPGQNPGWADSRVDLPYDVATLQNISKVLALPWFTRLWIWQEILSKPDTAVLQCGSTSLPWTEFCKGAWCLYIKRRDIQRLTREIDRDRLHRALYLSASGTASTFLELLNASRECQCSDYRDRIYSLLGLRRQSDQFPLQPDYTKSFADVYQDATMEYINFTGRLGILGFCDLKDLPMSLPSWVVDWSVPQRQNFPLPKFASLKSRAEVQSHDRDTLEVAGVEVATVDKVDWANDIFLPCQLSPTRFWSSLLELIYLHEDLSVESIIRTLCCNEFTDIYKDEPTPLPDFDLVQALVVPQLQVNRKNERFDEARRESAGNLALLEAQSESMAFFRRNVDALTKGRHIIRTATGMLGLGPDGAEPGDRLCVILGCDSPLILHPASDDLWLVIGVCYVDGLMFGEALLGQVPDHFRGVIRMNGDGNCSAQFSNQLSGQVTPRDPRSGPLPPGWKLLAHKKQEYYEAFENTETGERTVDDPRLTSEALRERGVAVRTFKLV